MAVKKFAFEAYIEWESAHPDRPCPPSLSALTEFMNSKDIRDPWGRNYVMACGEHGLGLFVVSPGPDGKLGTVDDIRSW
jgi:hypothetical protein